MPGTINKMITSMISQKAKGDPILEKNTKVKLILKGIDPDKFTATSDDDAAVIQKLKQLALELCVAV